MEPQPGGNEPFDRARVMARVGGNTSLLARMVRVFLDASPPWLADIRAAVREADPARLRETAHRLKGSASIFGAAAVVEAALRLEEMGRGADLTAAAEACSALEKTLGELHAALAPLAEPPPPAPG